MPIATSYSTFGPTRILLLLRLLHRLGPQPALALVRRPLVRVAAAVVQDVELAEAQPAEGPPVVELRKAPVAVQAEGQRVLPAQREPLLQPLVELRHCRPLQITPQAMPRRQPQLLRVAEVVGVAVAEAAVEVVPLQMLLPRLRRVPSLPYCKNGIPLQSCGPPKRQAIL